MQRTQRMLRKVSVYSPAETDSGYVGRRVVPDRVGFVYAEVFPDKSELSDERDGKRKKDGATLVLRRDAGVKCGDFMGVYSESPDSRVTAASIYPGHLTVRTERV